MKRLRLSRRMALLGVLVLAVFGGAASAYLTAAGAGTASARVGALSPPSHVTASATPDRTTVVIAWNAPTVGISAQGYYLLRTKSGANPAPACGTSATSLTTSTRCNDLGLPDGTYTYTVMAKYRSFTASAHSSAIAVATDNKAPAITLTSPEEGSATATATPTVSGAAGDATGDASTVTVKIYNGRAIGGSVNQTLNVSRSGASWSTTATTLAQGTYTVQATQTDTSDNIGTSTANTFVVDTSAPVLRTLEMLDSNANGKVDQVKATFTEALATSNATAPWKLTNVPSGGTLGAVSTSGAIATLTINEGSAGADTSVGSFNIALASNAGAIRDAAGNQASFAATAPSDLAKPVLMTATSGSGSAVDVMQAGDTLALTFSEPLAPNTVPNTPAVTESRSSSTGTLTITGLITPATIDFKYVGKNGNSATSNTASVLTNSNQTVTVTLGTITTNPGASVAAGSDGASIYPAASVKDRAGNAAASASPATARPLNPLF